MAIKNISLNEIAYSIMEFYRSKVLNTDEIDIRWLYFLINTARAKLLKQKFDKPFSNIDNHYVQHYLPVGQAVALELVDSSGYTAIPSGKYMSRTAVSIPATIESRGFNHCFTRIGPADKLKENFDIVSYEHALVYGNGKFNKNNIAAFLRDDRIYFVSNNQQILYGLKYIDVLGVFQNPVEVELANDPTWDEDDDYPVNMNLAEDIKKLILEEQFKLSYTPPIDTDPLNTELINK